MEKALNQKLFSYADRLKASASQVDFLRYRLSSAITAVYIATLETNEFAKSAPVRKDVMALVVPAPVELPEIPVKRRTLTVVPTPER